jgi:hypothetical protein
MAVQQVVNSSGGHTRLAPASATAAAGTLRGSAVQLGIMQQQLRHLANHAQAEEAHVTALRRRTHHAAQRRQQVGSQRSMMC